jgi:hypothetical protein
MMRAPEAPRGWPRAIAPPLGLTRSQFGSTSRPQASTTLANASLISITSRSSRPRPVRRRTRSVAGITPVSISTGSTPARANPANRASGRSPSRSAVARLASSRAAAPSEIWLEFPAVTCPSGRNAGFSPASFSIEVSRRTPSSARTQPASGPGTSTGTSCRSKWPASWAAAARRWDRRAKASCSSLVRPHFSVISSAEMPWGTRRPW